MSINHAWSLTRKEKETLQSLGEAWLSNGASRFGFRVNERIVYLVKSEQKKLQFAGEVTIPAFAGRSPADRPDGELCATVTFRNRQSGELFISNVAGEEQQKRLELDARFLADIGNLQGDMNLLSAELIERQDQIVMLYQLSQIMRRHLAIQPLFSSLNSTLQTLFHTKRLITLVSSGGLSPIVSAYPDNTILDQETITTLQQMHTDKKLEIVHSTRSDRIKNMLFLPLHVKDPFQASFVFANKIDGDFKTADLRLAQVIGEQISAQFEYVQLHQEVLAKARLQAEAEMARNVQMQLLPTRPPKIPGLDVFAQSKPASQVGGDFYLFITDASLPLLILGDVSGKGMPAAMLMTMLRSSFQSAARINDGRKDITANVLNDANKSMYGDFTSVEMFATSMVSAFDPDSRELTYSSAGHSPIIFCPSNGEPEILPANGFAMGVFPADIAGLGSITIKKDDLLVICTDGFNEAWNTAGEMYGYDRLLQLISSIRHYSAMEIAIEMYLAIEQFSGNREQDDDQTLIVIKGVDRASN